MSKEIKSLDFMNNVYPEPNSGCWLWGGYVNSYIKDGKWNAGGYGIHVYNGKRQYAHRTSYQIHKGPIPEGLVIDHLCKIRCCVNPDHLEAVTSGENSRRGNNNVKKDFCKNGHTLIGKNLRISGNGSRQCKQCASDRIYKRRGIGAPRRGYYS